MRGMLILALLLATRADAYTIVWGLDTTYRARLASVSATGEHRSMSFYDQSHVDYYACSVGDLARYARGERRGDSANVRGVGRCDAETQWTRTFRVIGGTGVVPVRLRWGMKSQTTGPGGSVHWRMGVDGIELIQGLRLSPQNEQFEFDWTGDLEYGETYTLRTDLDMVADGGASYVGAYWRDAPGYPTPEPSTWALLGLGLIPLVRLGLKRRS